MLGPEWVLASEIILFFLWFVFVVYEYLLKKEDIALKYILVVVENQEKAIEGIIRKTLLILHRFTERSQLIVIDMHSQDKTWQIITKMAYPKNNFSVYRFANNEDLDQLLNFYGSESLVLDYRLSK